MLLDELPGVRVGARVLPFTPDGRLLMMRRTKPGDVYVVSLGGGVEAGETVAEAAHREMAEEAGAGVELAGVVLTVLDEAALQYFYAARLTGMDVTTRTGPEFSRTDRRRYDLQYLTVGDPDLTLVRPAELRALLVRHWPLVRRVAETRATPR